MINITLEPFIRCDALSVSYGSSYALENVTFHVRRGEFIGIVGPSGSGKTSLLRAITGSVPAARGSVEVQSGTRIGYVPQVESVDWNFPITVAEVLTMTRTRRLWPSITSPERDEMASVLASLGLEGLEHRHIRELSGGQQQRVFVARAMFSKPDVLLLDEPTSGVDVRTRHEVLHLLHDLHDRGSTIVLTTHDLNGLASHLPRLVCLNREVIADGPPRETLIPEVLERTYGAPLHVLEHGGMPIVLDHDYEATQGSRAATHRLRTARRASLMQGDQTEWDS
ncbi:MAG: metal ABC transporter ATP-binding protein [Actinomycetota bacterium]